LRCRRMRHTRLHAMESYIALIESAELNSYLRVVQVVEGILQVMPNRVMVIRGLGRPFRQCDLGKGKLSQLHRRSMNGKQQSEASLAGRKVGKACGLRLRVVNCCGVESGFARTTRLNISYMSLEGAKELTPRFGSNRYRCTEWYELEPILPKARGSECSRLRIIVIILWALCGLRIRLIFCAPVQGCSGRPVCSAN
jgi:hypothetical protein